MASRFPARALCEMYWIQTILLVLWCAAILTGGIAAAEEPVAEFVQGLRSQGCFDLAFEYLDRIPQTQKLSPATLSVINFERAVTLQQSAERLVNADQRKERQQQAVALYARFLSADPEHALASQARTLQGEIQLDLARQQLGNAEEESDADQSAVLRQEVRQQIQQLREVFLQMRDRSQAAWERYPAFIPEEEPELRKVRNRAQEMLIRSSLDLAQCDYWEAQTFPVGSPERLDLLRRSGTEYEAIHQRFRSQVGGLYARLWQGKCYEEMRSQAGVRLALGIYGEILEHDGTSPQLIRLRDLALNFRLVCLNSEFRKDYQLVELEAEEWLETAGDRADSDTGLAITWELCRALEMLGEDERWAPDTRLDYLSRARDYAKMVATHGREHSSSARAVIERIDKQLPDADAASEN
ncbi:hypothetical protein SH661x_003630 [Planctomicrobium sp. SH661]|uniref:hypothetical protein n=1 Tax=Planctomicrobium sp. SH661 TaxID=3448124 RepID=UPI003F5C3AAC